MDRSIVEMSYYACALTAKTLSGDTLTYSTLGQSRGSLAAASWGNTIVFAGGRINESTNLNNVDIINATTLVRTTATLSVGRSYLAGASANGKIFFAGGIRGSSPLIASNVVDIYDVSSNTWTATTLPSGARHSLTAIGYGGRVYFAGGGTDGSYPYKVNPPSDAIDIYDTTTNAWLPSKTLGTARAQLASAAINNKILFTCGSLTNSSHTDKIDIYDVLTDTWSSVSLSTVTGNSTNAARGSLGCAAINNKIVFGGGVSGTTITKRVDIYDTVTGSWTCLPTQLSIQKVGLCAVGLNNVIVFSTGSDGNNSLTNIIDIYNTSTDTWTTKVNLPEGISTPDAGKVYDLAGAAAGNIIIFGGGFYPPGPTPYTYIYTPPYYI